ncbi:MAG: hypothetical protein ACPGEG_05130 [Salibacteraceae bacterium]
MKKVITSVVAFAALTCVVSCSEGDGGQLEKDQAQAAQEEMLDEMADAGMEEESESFYLPSALQIGSIFQKSGLDYVSGITNSVDKKDDYITKTSKILNFGVYSADLAYIVLNGQSQDAMNYLKTISTLSDEIGFGTIFESKELMERFQNNLGNQDSVINVMIDIQAATDMFVDDNNLQDVTYIIFAGAWIEGMYIGVKASDHKKTHMVSGRLVEQMTILDNLVKALRSNKNQPEEITELSKKLLELEKFFNRLEENKNSQNIASFRDYKLSPEHLKQLSDMIVDLRTSIVNG